MTTEDLVHGMGINCVVVPMLKYVGLGVLGQEIFSNLSSKDSLESENKEDVMKSESREEKQAVDIRLDSENEIEETEFVMSSSCGYFQQEEQGLGECRVLEQDARLQDSDSVSSLSDQESLWEAAEHIQERLDQITSSVLELRDDSSRREKADCCERLLELEVHCSSIENQLNDIIRHGFLHALPQARNCDEYHR